GNPKLRLSFSIQLINEILASSGSNSPLPVGCLPSGGGYQSVGTVERSDTHQSRRAKMMGFANGSTHPTRSTYLAGRSSSWMVIRSINRQDVSNPSSYSA